MNTRVNADLSDLPILSQLMLRGFRRQSGAGMVEVLIAIVIIAFALLGMAGLQVASLRYQKVAHFRSLATQFEAEIGERIRANIAGANANNYVATGLYSSAAACAPYVPTVCANEACVATEDINAWRASLACGLSGGWGEISGNVAANGYLLVTVYFKEPNKKDYDDTLDANCRAGALGSGDTDVRCFLSVVVP